MANANISDVKVRKVKKDRKKIISCHEIGDKYDDFKSYLKSGHNDKALIDELEIDKSALDQLKMLLALEQVGQLYNNRTIYKKYFNSLPPRAMSVTKAGILLSQNKIESLGAKDIFTEGTEIDIRFEDNMIIIAKK